MMGHKQSAGNVVSLSEVRDEKIEERRREFERVVFRSNFGAYTPVDGRGLQAIELVDISEGGILFQVAENSNYSLQQGEATSVRLYFSTEGYISIDVKVARSFIAMENGRAVHRYGCIMDKTMSSYAAFYHLVHFITKCAEHGHHDGEHHKIYY